MHAPLKEEFTKSFNSIVERNSFIKGKELDAFESEFASWVGTNKCIGVGSGHDALVLGLKALGVKDGAKVIVPAMTFISTVEAVLQAGGTPELVDVDTNGLIDLAQAEEKIKIGIKYMIPVHLYGKLVDPYKINHLIEKYNIVVMEDCAQAHGATLDNINAGTIGHASAFSFYPGKNLGALGDGGAICTNSKSVSEKIIALREHGQTEKYHHKYIGMTSRLDNMQAAFLSIKLKHMNNWNKQRINGAKLYQEKLKENSNIELKGISLAGDHVFHLLIINSKQIDKVIEQLTSDQIAFGRHYPVPIHKLECFESIGWDKLSFPSSEDIAYNSISLPLFPGITEEEISLVCQSINSSF